MNKLSMERRAAIVRCLSEGSSVRSTCRITGASKATVLKLLVEVGEFCSLYQHHVLSDLPCTRIEADEIWAFCGAKAKNAKHLGQGDIWTFTAICADTKLMVSWLVGDRSADSAHEFMHDVASRLRRRPQISTDGHSMYLTAVESAFGYNGADFGQVIKSYGAEKGIPAGRYSPAECTGIEKKVIYGNPDEKLISTSYVECQNLNMRMSMRRFTRLTNGFSKKAENHAHAVGLYFMVYNFCKSHGTLTKAAKGVHTTPAMAAGVTNRVWTIESLLSLMDDTAIIGDETPLQSN